MTEKKKNVERECGYLEISTGISRFDLNRSHGYQQEKISLILHQYT